jgi:Flp pilus assembly protein TadD
VIGVAAGLLLAVLHAIPDPLADAERLLESRNYKAAEAAFRRILETDPSNARAHGNLALALLKQGRAPEAVDEGRLAAAFGAGQPEAFYIYGRTLLSAGRPVEAARELEKAVREWPAEPAPLAMLASAYAASGDERTAATYERLIELRPDSPSLRVDLAEHLWQAGKNEAGNRAIENAREAFPSNADLAVRQGRALAHQDRAGDAAEALEAARRLGAADADTLRLLASCYQRADRPGAARVVLEDAVTAHPDDASLQADLGRLLLAEARPADALPHLERAAASPDATALVNVDLGRAREGLGRPEEAESAYRKALRLSPTLPEAHFALGRLLQRQGRSEEARKELATHHELYERARQLVASSNSRAAEIAYAWAELNAGNSAVALTRFQALPESAEVWRGRALALSRLGRRREAVAAFEKALELSPGDGKLELLLAAERLRPESKP